MKAVTRVLKKSVKKLCLLLVLGGAGATSSAFAANILFVEIIPDTGLVYSGSDVAQMLADGGHVVTQRQLTATSTALPADLTAYDQVWVWDMSSTADNAANQLVSYNRIVQWFQNRGPALNNIILDSRMLAATSHIPKSQYPLLPAAMATYSETNWILAYADQLNKRGGGLVLGTDHANAFTRGINDINAGIGIGSFAGFVHQAPYLATVDPASPFGPGPVSNCTDALELNSGFNELDGQSCLVANTSVSFTPYNLQANGMLLLPVASYYVVGTILPVVAAHLNPVLENNSAPISDAGSDFDLRESSVAQLDGSNSYDNEGDTLTFYWEQTAGPLVVLDDATSAMPGFTAPAGSTQLEFSLVVNDGEFDSDNDTVIVNITGNNAPEAITGVDITVDELTEVFLDGSASSDPDGDGITYVWNQVSGAAVILADDDTASPSFMAPQVPAGGEDLVFELVVTDDYASNPLASEPAPVTVHVANIFDAPSCEMAAPSVSSLWPPNNKLVPVHIEGVTPEDSPAGDILIFAVTQDEPTGSGKGKGKGNNQVDAVIFTNGAIDGVALRAERDGQGNGRVYEIHFESINAFGSCTGSVQVEVPHSRNASAADDGQDYDSL